MNNIKLMAVDLAKNVFQVCALDDRYLILNAGQTVLDLQTGLEWMRCIVGQVWNGSTCEMTEARQPMFEGQDDAMGIFMSWQNSLLYIENLNVAGFASNNDWRMSNLKEAISIQEYSCYTPAINNTVFPNTPSYDVWSSTTNPNSSRTALGAGAGFGIGISSKADTIVGPHTRIVRTYPDTSIVYQP